MNFFLATTFVIFFGTLDLHGSQIKKKVKILHNAPSSLEYLQPIVQQNQNIITSLKLAGNPKAF